MAAFSDDLRARVLDAVLTEQMSYGDAAERFRVSKAWVTKIVCRFRQTGEAGAYSTAAGPAPRLDEAARAQMRQWLDAEPDLLQREVAERFTAKGISVQRSTVGRALKDMGWTRKKSRSSRPSSSAPTSSSNARRGKTKSPRR